MELLARKEVWEEKEESRILQICIFRFAALPFWWGFFILRLKQTNLIMKNVIVLLLTVFFFSSPNYCLSQDDLIEIKVDEFTGDTTIFTTWVKLKGTKRFSYLRFAKIEDAIVLNLRYATAKHLSVDDGYNVFFKMANGEIINLLVPEFIQTCEGCGAIGFVASSAQGFNFYFILDDDLIQELETQEIEMFRISTRRAGYIDEKIRESSAIEIQKALTAIKTLSN